MSIVSWGPFLEGPEKFSFPESHVKNLTELFFSHSFNTNKFNFHAKFNAYVHCVIF